MVRPDDQSGKKGTGHSRKTSLAGEKPGSAEPYNTPLWPCEINGCGKQFVREADLRRHQRTTKVHANPNFVCDECGASFTRTDALKRHEKSKSHVARAPSGMFIEDGATTTSAETTKNGSTSSELSTQSRSSRSLSPGPSREKEKERRERERRLGDRELPPLRPSPSSRYYRSHTASFTPYEQPPAPSNSQSSLPFSRPQTHSPSLNAILASPISTPRLHPAKWALPSPGQSNGYAQPPPPPPPPLAPPPSKPSNGHYVPHYRYPRSPPRAVPHLLAPEHHPTSPSHEPHEHEHEPSSSTSFGRQDTRPRGQLDTCHTTASSSIRKMNSNNSKGNKSSTSSSSPASITPMRRKESPSFTPSPSPVPVASPPVPKHHFAVPPIAAAPSERSIALATLSDGDSISSDSDGPEELDEEVDELESTDSEAEPQESHGLRSLAPIKPVTQEEKDSRTATASHSIRDIDIEDCIDPVATGITEEEVKAAMDDVRKQEREQEQAEQQVKAAENASAAVVDHRAHGGRLGALGIAIRTSGAGAVDQDDGSPFLSEMVLSSPSSRRLAVNGASVHRNGGHPGGGGHHGRTRGDSPSSLLGDSRDQLDQDFHHHRRLNRRRHSHNTADEDEESLGLSSRLDGSGSDVDMKAVYDEVDVDVGDMGASGRSLGKRTANRMAKAKTYSMDLDNGINGSDSPHDHGYDHRHNGYSRGGGHHTSPSLDRSISRSPLDQYHPYHHHDRQPHSHANHRNGRSIIDDEDKDEHMPHRHHHHHTPKHHTHNHQHQQLHPTELLTQVTMPL